MAQLTINTGSSAGAGDGDSLYTAFNKVNTNFTELYSKVTVLENGTIAVLGALKGTIVGDDSTILVDGVSSSINLNGTVKGNIVPDTDEAYDLGSSSKKFKDLYLKGTTINLGNQTISATGSGIATSGTLTATAVTTTAPSTLSGTFTGDVTGSVFADDSNVMIDGVAGKIVGDVENTTINTQAIRSSNTSTGNLLLQGSTTDLGGGSITIWGGPAGAVGNGGSVIIDAGNGGSGPGDTKGNIAIGTSNNVTGSVTIGDTNNFTSLRSTNIVIGQTSGVTNLYGNTVFRDDLNFSNVTSITGFTGDITGSVFADDSGTLIDGVAGKVVGPVENATVTTSLIETGSITNTTQPQMSITSTDGALILSNTNLGNPGAGVGSDIEITSMSNAVAIRGEAYVSVTSGPLGGPYADLDMYGGPITLHGDVLFGSGASIDFANAKMLVTGVNESFTSLADATGVVAHDCSLGHVFYHTSPDANWTVNLTNLNLDSGNATAITLVIVQGATAYYPSALQIGGSAQTIYWQGGSAPSSLTADGIDVATFSIINNGGTYTVLGQVTGFDN